MTSSQIFRANKVAINKLLHFADNTISYLDVTHKEDFKNTQIAEYSVAGKPSILRQRPFYLTIQSDQSGPSRFARG